MPDRTARHHHYLSQCYLRGFTDGRSKKSKLTVIDIIAGKSFKTSTRNVGGIRDFNTIEIEGILSDSLERDLARFESAAATALRSIERETRFDGEEKEVILNLVGLLALRTPGIREKMRRFQAEVAEKVMDLTLASRDQYEAIVDQMRQDGHDVSDEIDFDDLKEFHERGKYEIEIAREWQIHLEFAGFEAVLPYLFDRKWALLTRGHKCGPFITSDHPVVLVWKNPERVPLMYRASPGHGMRETMVYFPLSQELALVGDFEGKDVVREGTDEQIANFNTLVMHMAHRQLYAPKMNFLFAGKDGELLNGSAILRHFRSKRSKR